MQSVNCKKFTVADFKRLPPIKHPLSS